MRWLLEDPTVTAITASEKDTNTGQVSANASVGEAGTKDSSASTKEKEGKEAGAAGSSADPNSTSAVASTVQPGDIICFPILNTGAGEFECLRFVGKERRPDGRWLILDGSGDIEMPCFPKEIVELVGGSENLKGRYKSGIRSNVRTLFYMSIGRCCWGGRWILESTTHVHIWTSLWNRWPMDYSIQDWYGRTLIIFFSGANSGTMP